MPELRNARPRFHGNVFTLLTDPMNLGTLKTNILHYGIDLDVKIE